MYWKGRMEVQFYVKKAVDGDDCKGEGMIVDMVTFCLDDQAKVPRKIERGSWRK